MFVIFTDDNPLSYLHSAKLEATEYNGLLNLLLSIFEIKINQTAAIMMRMRFPGWTCQVPAWLSMPYLARWSQYPFQQASHLESMVPKVSGICPPVPLSADIRSWQEADPLLKNVLVFWRSPAYPRRETCKYTVTVPTRHLRGPGHAHRMVFQVKHSQPHSLGPR